MNKRLNTRVICFISLFVALQVVLERFVSINTLGYKIGIGFVPTAMCAMMYGPIPAAVTCAMADFLGAMLFPFGPYHPGFTACAAAMGLVYGVFLFRGESSCENRLFSRFGGKVSVLLVVLIPALINNLVLGLLINTVWVAQLYDSRSYWGWFLYRVPQYVLLASANIILLPVLLKISQRIKHIFPACS